MLIRLFSRFLKDCARIVGKLKDFFFENPRSESDDEEKNSPTREDLLFSEEKLSRSGKTEGVPEPIKACTPREKFSYIGSDFRMVTREFSIPVETDVRPHAGGDGLFDEGSEPAPFVGREKEFCEGGPQRELESNEKIDPHERRHRTSPAMGKPVRFTWMGRDCVLYVPGRKMANVAVDGPLVFLEGERGDGELFITPVTIEKQDSYASFPITSDDGEIVFPEAVRVVYVLHGEKVWCHPVFRVPYRVLSVKKALEKADVGGRLSLFSRVLQFLCFLENSGLSMKEGLSVEDTIFSSPDGSKIIVHPYLVGEENGVGDGGRRLLKWFWNIVKEDFRRVDEGEFAFRLIEQDVLNGESFVALARKIQEYLPGALRGIKKGRLYVDVKNFQGYKMFQPHFVDMRKKIEGNFGLTCFFVMKPFAATNRHDIRHYLEKSGYEVEFVGDSNVVNRVIYHVREMYGKTIRKKPVEQKDDRAIIARIMKDVQEDQIDVIVVVTGDAHYLSAMRDALVKGKMVYHLSPTEGCLNQRYWELTEYPGYSLGIYGEMFPETLNIQKERGEVR